MSRATGAQNEPQIILREPQMSARPEKPAKRMPEPEPEEEPEDGEDLGEEDEDDEEFYDEGMDLGAVLEPFLATEDGQTIATALVSISKHMENQNKILIKILSKMAGPSA